TPNRLVKRRALAGKKLWTAVSDVKTVFQTDAELAIDHDRRFVAKAHARLNRRLIAAHEISPLVTVEADPVAGAMRQSRSLVIGSKAGIGQHLARGCIDWVARCPHPCA